MPTQASLSKAGKGGTVKECRFKSAFALDAGTGEQRGAHLGLVGDVKELRALPSLVHLDFSGNLHLYDSREMLTTVTGDVQFPWETPERPHTDPTPAPRRPHTDPTPTPPDSNNPTGVQSYSEEHNYEVPSALRESERRDDGSFRARCATKVEQVLGGTFPSF